MSDKHRWMSRTVSHTFTEDDVGLYFLMFQRCSPVEATGTSFTITVRDSGALLLLLLLLLEFVIVFKQQEHRFMYMFFILKNLHLQDTAVCTEDACYPSLPFDPR
jgi:hypothetical protein